MDSENLSNLTTEDEVEALFLNSDGPEYETIQLVDTEAEAMHIAKQFLELEKVVCDVHLLESVVRKIRD